ncbi:MAG: GGDEF domain-containing protein [Desulfobacter sp.]|nr:MAG: GGDEF domain-containing protein [Desulfobacter sp.]
MAHAQSLTSKSIIGIPLALIVTFTIASVLLIDLYFEKTAIVRYEKALIQQARSGARILEFLKNHYRMADYDAFADHIARGSLLRVTIIGKNGWIIGDSRLSFAEVQEAENRSQRPEIVKAREHGAGLDRRYSQTVGVELLYAAVRYRNEKMQGFFRVAVPMRSLNEELVHQRMVLGGFCIITLLVAGILSLLASRYLLGLVRREEDSLERKVRERTREIEILQNLGTQLTACNTYNEARNVIAMVAPVLMPRFSGAMAIFDDEADRLKVIDTWNGEWGQETVYEPAQCWALRKGSRHLGDTKAGNATCSHWSGTDRTMLCLPLVAQGESLGVLHISIPSEDVFSQEEQNLALALAEQASLAFGNLKLQEALRDQAIRDALTTLYNRRFLLESAEQQISRAGRRNQSLGLLMMDLDHFKKINDTHGHDTGDHILKEFGLMLRGMVRAEDIPCRYGGEEFTLILPETGHEATCQTAQKICDRIRSHEFSLDHRSPGTVTISVGGAVYPDNGTTLDQLIKEADKALYTAKSQGRDRVVMAKDTT